MASISSLRSIVDLVHPSSSGYALALFRPEEIAQLEIIDKKGAPYVRCLVTDRDRPAKPEEIVRQLFLRRLIQEYRYPKERIFLEKAVFFGSSVAEKRADIFISEKDNLDTAYIIVELKKPKRRDGLEQLKSYCNAEGSPFGVWTNGAEIVFLNREEPNIFKSLPDIPRSDQKLSDLFHQAWNAPGVSISAVPLGNAIQTSHNTRNHMQHSDPAATVDDQHCADAISDAVAVIEHCWPGTTAAELRDWMRSGLRIVRLYSSRGDLDKRTPFEDEMRRGQWGIDKKQPRTHELKIEPGRRQYWTLLLTQSQVQVEAILNTLGIP
jgi:hypothetical protein